MSMFDKESMRLNVRKELHLNSWDLLCLLRNAGIVDDDGCMPEVKMVEKTEVNEGRTVIISWSQHEQRLAVPMLTEIPDRETVVESLKDLVQSYLDDNENLVLDGENLEGFDPPLSHTTAGKLLTDFVLYVKNLAPSG